jgi:hypothetical protein
MGDTFVSVSEALAMASVRHLEHFPEKACPGRDPEWIPAPTDPKVSATPWCNRFTFALSTSAYLQRRLCRLWANNRFWKIDQE